MVAVLTVALLCIAKRFTTSWGNDASFAGVAMLMDLFDTMLDWTAFVLADLEGDLKFCNDPDGVLRNGLFTVVLVGSLLFLFEAGYFLGRSHISKWIFVLHIGCEDLLQVILYGFVAGAHSEQVLPGTVLGIVQSLIFLMAKLGELLAGNSLARHLSRTSVHGAADPSVTFTSPISPRLSGFQPLSRDSRFVPSRNPFGPTDQQSPPGLAMNARVPGNESNSSGALVGHSKASKLNNGFI